MKEKKVTIQTVAERSNVSKTTVSKYLNGQFQYMSKATASRIAQAIQELDYRPSLTARSLKASKSHLIGVIMPHVWSLAIARSIQSVCSECEKHNYNAIICSSEDSSAQETECINRLIDLHVDGILCYTGGTNKHYKEVDVPVVITNRYREDCTFDMVIIENYDVVKQALDMLLSNGYQRVAFLTTPVTPLSAKIIRERAFDDFVREKGLSGEDFPKYCVESGTIQAFSDALLDFSNRSEGKKIAVFASSNSVMRRAKTAMDMNQQIRQDLGFCGYELGSENEDGYIPGALILQYPLRQMARQAVDLLLTRIDGDMTDGPTRLKITPVLRQCPAYLPVQDK